MTSRQEVQVYQIVKASPRWLDNREIASRTGIHERTARHHTRKLAQAGVFEEVRLPEGFLYRFKREDAEINRLIGPLSERCELRTDIGAAR